LLPGILGLISPINCSNPSLAFFFPSFNDLIILGKRLANFFCKEPDSKYFRPRGLCKFSVSYSLCEIFIFVGFFLFLVLVS
jgi:hypothetical protein